MKDYLGELEDDDLIMFVVEHLKDHKGPVKLIEGLEPVSAHIVILSHCLIVVLRIHYAGAGRRSRRIHYPPLEADRLRKRGLCGGIGNRRHSSVMSFRSIGPRLVRFALSVLDRLVAAENVSSI